MKLRHYENEGYARFVTFCTHNRIPLLSNDRFRRYIVDAIAETRTRLKFRLIAYVVMPEHVHCVLVPHGDSGVGQIIGEMKRLSARHILADLRAAN